MNESLLKVLPNGPRPARMVDNLFAHINDIMLVICVCMCVCVCVCVCVFVCVCVLNPFGCGGMQRQLPETESCKYGA